MTRIPFCAGLALCATAAPASAQRTPADSPFVAIPAAQASRYRVDLARHFFASPDAERAERAAVLTMAEKVYAMRGRVGASADSLERALALVDSALMLLSRHQAYLTMRSWTDIRDTESRNAQVRLNGDVGTRADIVVAEIRALSDSALTRYYSARPSLARYRFAIDGYRRSAPASALDGRSAELLRTLTPLISDWQTDLYNQMLARGADATREQDTYAFILIQRARSGTQLAQLAGYASAAERSYAARLLTPAHVNGVTAALASQGELNKRFESARIANLKRSLGRDSVRYIADYSAPAPSATVPRFTIDEARHAITGAFAPLGAEYARELTALLDPANGRLDIVPGPNRAGGGTTPTALPGSAPSVFYTLGYTGAFGDVITFAHETSHAVHFQLMSAARVPPMYGNGPQFLTEAFSYFGELLLTDYLYRQESTPARKVFYAEQFLDRAFQSFTQARDAAFEAALYDSVAAGRIRNARDVNALFDAIGSKYSVWHGLDSDASVQWIRIPHYARNPFYRVNYMYARLLALRMFEAYQRDGGAFMSRFIGLLRAGYSAAPADLLKQHLGIDLDGPDLVRSAVASLAPRLAALERLYE